MPNLLKPNKSYECEICDFSSCNLKDYKRHLNTRKHQSRTNMNNIEQENPIKTHNVFTCECGKEYKARNSLWYHKKTCSNVLGEENTNTIIDTTTTTIDKSDMTQKLVELIMSKNQEFMTELVSNITNTNNNMLYKMMEIMPHMGNTTNNNNTNNTNSHNTTNNQFNIQMFLNEHCKNAMNLTEFIESLPITATTFDNTIENGLTKTITNMITNGLSKLDILERPIHCTDATRKTLYVKEANVWEKDTELKKVVSGITNLIVKKRDLICKWKEANRGWDTIESKQIRFTELVCNLMTDVERDEKETGKIIRAISKTVYLDNEDKKKYLC